MPGKMCFLCLQEKYSVGLSVTELLEIYRYHEPQISLPSESAALLLHLRRKNIRLGIISDGRSRTQRNKLRALGLDWIEDVVIDEAYRGKGLSKMLVRHAIDFVKSQGIPALMLTSNPKRTAANKLYQTMGFEQKETNVYRMNC